MTADVTTQDEMRVLDDGVLLAGHGKLKTVSLDLLYLENNVRTKQTEQIPSMVASIKRHGFKQNHPIVVSAKADGRFLVLCGNRRTKAVLFLRDNEPETFARLFPKGLIPAIIHDKLTDVEEVLLRVDHGTDEDRVGLDEWGEYLAVQQLVQVGYETQAGIAAKLGKYKLNTKTGLQEPRRSWVQPRVTLAKLPKFVQKEMRAYCDDSSASNLRWSDIPKLYKTYNEELADHPHGDGPALREAFDKILAGADSNGENGSASPLTVAQMAERAKSCNSKGLREALLSSAGKVTITLQEVDERILRSEAAEDVLSDIAAYLGDVEFGALVEKARQARIAAESASADSPAETAEAVA